MRRQRVTIIKPITATEWGTKGFYVEDPDGYIIASAAARQQFKNRVARDGLPSVRRA